ncbi:hypothetical protein SLEP1_g30534 [Rubroshorea leprosula]|uniref:Uncharacterized protein n=1 Tax=Rubroshorea leprosula TaxID=152421 RepID=A0AAV5K7Z2_9ROSI|nr:hypothetical protein SLEP1_g30534 [Rubroshorea leprosula]
MSSLFKGSPYRRRHDLEAGSSRSPSSDNQDDGMSSSPFYITRTKNASIERLRRWRVILP